MPNFLRIGAILTMIGVMLGAFGAHALRTQISPASMAIFETGLRYHLLHSMATCAVGLCCNRLAPGFGQRVGWLFVAGIAIFGGSLYLLALTDVKWLGAITPIGGVCFIVGWFELARGAKA